jgi:hypothetical protein
MTHGTHKPIPKLCAPPTSSVICCKRSLTQTVARGDPSPTRLQPPPGDCVEGLSGFGKLNGEFGTVESANQEGAVASISRSADLQANQCLPEPGVAFLASRLWLLEDGVRTRSAPNRERAPVPRPGALRISDNCVYGGGGLGPSGTRYLVPSMPHTRDEWSMLVVILGSTISPLSVFLSGERRS